MPRSPSSPHISPAPITSETLPRRVNRRDGAELIRRLYFPVSPRTLEAWPLAWRHVGGYAVCETAELLAEAERRFDAAPVIRGGRNRVIAEPAQRATSTVA